LAFDFIDGKDSEPLIAEVSYCCVPLALKDCIGYQEIKLELHEESMWPEDAILESILTNA